MKRVIEVSDTLYKTCRRLVDEGDPRPSESCIANSEPYGPQGEWIEASEINIFGEEVKCFECSNCHKTRVMHILIHEKLPFCPNCGAEMCAGDK